VRVKPKFGRIYTTTLFANFLFFSNHFDALQLPTGDRRFAVLQNPNTRRSSAEYGELVKFLNNPLDIARLYWWYMERDVSNFDRIYPPMTPAKERMIRQAHGALDEVWDEAITSLPGALVTREVLRTACITAAGEDLDLAQRASKMALAKWRKLEPFGRTVSIDKRNHSTKILRDHETAKKNCAGYDNSWAIAELRKNIAR
jgi:hypothetical protein